MSEYAALAIGAGMVLVRLGWNGRPAVAIGGWVLVAVALIGCGRDAGAWGLAVGTSVGMAAAVALLLWSGWATAPRAPRPGRERLTAMRGQGSGQGLGLVLGRARLARRVFVFLLVVPCGGMAALFLAFGVQAAARRAGMGEGDAAACLLLLLPILWAGLSVWQMTRGGPRQMILPPLLATAAGTLLWAAR